MTEDRTLRRKGKDPSRWDWQLYNRHDVLRVRWPFWMAMLYELRHLLLILIIGLAHGRSGDGAGMGQLAALVDPWFIPADGPAFLLLLAVGSRVPAGGAAARWVWRRGRLWLSAGIVLFLTLLLWRNGLAFRRWSWAEWAETAVNLVLLAWVWRSAWLRDLFAQFPAPEKPKPAR